MPGCPDKHVARNTENSYFLKVLRHCKRRVIDFVKTVARDEQGRSKGYFEPDSQIRKINQEAVVLLGGGYAILLQLAHPFVAAGVDDHSNFQSEILSRLHRTILFMHNLVFEDRQRARKELQHFHAMHDRIRGRLEHRAGNFPSNMHYSGTDPEAKLWVHATFVNTSLKLYQQFIRPLTQEERRDYYADSLIQARLLEIPEDILPQTPEEFDHYMRQMLSGDTLVVTETARRLAQAVLYPRVGFFPSLSARLLRFVTSGLLPERFRKAYGLRWSRKDQYLLDTFSGSIRLLRPVSPKWVWQTPVRGGRLTRFLLWSAGK